MCIIKDQILKTLFPKYLWDLGEKIPKSICFSLGSRRKVRRAAFCIGYQKFANDGLLEDNGDLILNEYNNDGGFIFANWDKNNQQTLDSNPTPNKSKGKSGLVHVPM